MFAKFLFSSNNFLCLNNIFFLILVGFIPATIYSQTPTPTPYKPTDIANLESGKPIERAISGTLRQTYLIPLPANQYTKILLEQRGIDLTARLYNTDNVQITDYDIEFNPNKQEIIEFVPKTEGVYRIDIINKFQRAPAGNYQIQIVDKHPATQSEIVQQQARELYSAANRLRNAGKFSEAREALEKAIAANKKELGLDNQTTAANFNLFASILAEQGEYQEAIKISLENLANQEKSPNKSQTVIGITLSRLGSSYRSLEEYPKAVEYNQRALAVWEREIGETSPAVAVGLLNLGGTYNDLGDRSKALEFFQKALAIQEKTARNEDDNTAAILINIGLHYTDEGDYPKAETYLLRGVAVMEKLYQPGNPRLSQAQFALASCYAAMQRLDKAEQLFMQVLQDREKNLGANHPLTGYSALSLANISARRRDFKKAEPLYRRALQIREETFGDSNTAVSSVLNELIQLLDESGDISQAVELQQKSNEINERNLGLNLTIGSERQKLDFLKYYFNLIDQNVYRHIHFAPENSLAAELAVTTILRQKGRVQDAVSNSLETLRRRSDPQDRILLDNLNKITGQIAQIILEGTKGKPAEFQAEVKKITEEREKLEDEISRRAAGFFVKSQPVTLAEVKRAIPADTHLLEFAVYYPVSFFGAKTSGEKRYAVYLVQNEGPVKWKDLGAAQPIETAINDWRKALRDPKRKDVKILARAVDEKIMQPVRAFLGSAQKMLISPDGDLNLIPFEALVDEKGNFLVENYSFTYLTSGRDLLRLQTKRPDKSGVSIIANPAFSTNAEPVKPSITATRNITDTYFAPLTATIREAQAIQTLFPGAVIYSETKATETMIKELNAPSVLHIATHGFFLENLSEKTADSKEQNRETIYAPENENPLLRSGIALAGANQRTGIEDGILTALEASGLNLWGTKLVVLSACDTGLGEVKTGEGVYGLRRAFVLAGTESLVMSLWPVSDYVTRELMIDYYKNLKSGVGRGESLRRVQLSMLKKNDRAHPFYWAAFIHSGEWANLDGRR